MIIQNIFKMTALDIGRAIHSGEVSSSEVTDVFLSKIKSENKNVFINITEDRARLEAQAADDRIKTGRKNSLLDGVPIAWKDLFDFKGCITTAGSVLFEDRSESYEDAVVVKNAAEAGMISLGKLNMTEMAYSGIGINPHFGTPKNVCSDEIAFVPGGSSSGSAVSVGLGFVPCAIGTDTGGSVRIPAALNGLVGYKTSEGRYSRKGLTYLSRSLDTIGPLARSVTDCSEIDRILCGKGHQNLVSENYDKPKFYVVQNIVLDALDDEVEKNFYKAVDTIRAAGFAVEKIEIPVFDKAQRMFETVGTLAACDSYLEYNNKLSAFNRERMDQRVLDRILRGQSMKIHDLAKLNWLRLEGLEEIKDIVGNGFILMPTCPILAPEINKLENDKELFHRINLKVLRNTMFGNFFNMPGLTLPTGKSNIDGRYSAILISSKAGSDNWLLKTGQEIQQVLDIW